MEFDRDSSGVQGAGGSGTPTARREAVARALVRAGADAASGGQAAPGMSGDEARTLRSIARYLVGDVDDRALDDLTGAAASVGLADAIEGMLRRAQRIEPDVADADDLARRCDRVRNATAIAVARRSGELARSFEQFASAAAQLVHAERWEELTSRAVESMCDLTRMDAAALYISADESARMILTSSAPGGSGGIDFPQDVRIDKGLLADVLAGERAAWVGEAASSVLGSGFSGAESALAIPLRDQAGRPVGVLLACNRTSGPRNDAALETAWRFGSVVEGALVVAERFRRDAGAIAMLPAVADLDPGLDLDSALEQLAGILGEATSSDAVLVRVADPDGGAVRVRAVWSRDGRVVGELLGSAVPARGAHPVERCEEDGEWLWDDLHRISLAPATRRALEALEARSVAFVSVPLSDGRSGLARRAGLILLRRTARSLSPLDTACATIVAAQVARVLDVGDAEHRTKRAIGAARTAIRLLGEALVAGVRGDRTLRFVPRLFSEMFRSAGCRVWRLDQRRDEASPVVLAAHGGDFSDEPHDVVARALAAPLELFVDTGAGGQYAAVAFEEYSGSRICIELVLTGERALGNEERELALDVAQRIEEAVLSADRAAAQRIQLDRVRSLQEVVSSAYTELTEQHVLGTVVERVPPALGSQGCAAFLFTSAGSLTCVARDKFPDALADEIVRAGHWVPGASGDDRDDVQRVESLETDQRTVRFHQLAQATPELRGTAMLAIPFVGREQVLGALVLVVPDGLPIQFLDRQDMLPAFGRHVGTALVHADNLRRERERRERTERLLEQEREASRQVRALHEVARTFADSLSYEETLRAVVEAMAHRLDVDAVWIRTPDERGSKMLLRAFYASQPELQTALERMIAPPDARDDPVNAHVMQSRQPVLVQGGAQHTGELGSSDLLVRLEPFLQRGSSLAVLPVARPTDTDTLGTLTLLSIDPDHALTYDKVDVASTVTSQAALALDNARLYEQQKHFAEVIQESLLPGRLPSVPGVDLGVLYRAATAGGADARAIGGDFYDFMELEDGRLALAVGDVTGKGVGAAADTAMTKYIFRAIAREHPSPGAFLTYANDVICDEITPGKFVTLFYAVIDTARNEIICGNAGHPESKLMHVGADGAAVIESVQLEGLALGILPHQDYEERRYDFGPGRSIVSYTDGVVEARRDTRLYGQYRLERRLAEEAGASATRLAFALYEDCNAYAEDRLSDDVAIVVAQHAVGDDDE